MQAKEARRLGVKDLVTLNQALSIKWWWEVLQQWVKNHEFRILYRAISTIQEKKKKKSLPNPSIYFIHSATPFWWRLIALQPFSSNASSLKLGSSTWLLFWHDNWTDDDVPLKLCFLSLSRFATTQDCSAAKLLASSRLRSSLPITPDLFSNTLYIKSCLLLYHPLISLPILINGNGNGMVVVYIPLIKKCCNFFMNVVSYLTSVRILHGKLPLPGKVKLSFGFVSSTRYWWWKNTSRSKGSTFLIDVLVVDNARNCETTSWNMISQIRVRYLPHGNERDLDPISLLEYDISSFFSPGAGF